MAVRRRSWDAKQPLLTVKYGPQPPLARARSVLGRRPGHVKLKYAVAILVRVLCGEGLKRRAVCAANDAVAGQSLEVLREVFLGEHSVWACVVPVPASVPLCASPVEHCFEER